MPVCAGILSVDVCSFGWAGKGNGTVWNDATSLNGCGWMRVSTSGCMHELEHNSNENAWTRERTRACCERVERAL